MNKQRKAEVKAEIDTLRTLRKSMRTEPAVLATLADELGVIKSRMISVHEDEQNEYENMSEKQQCSTQGEISEESMALLEDAIDYMDELINDVKSTEEPDVSEIGYSMEDVIDLLNDVLNM